MPLVSVILPNYNHAAFLDRRIRSILAQTFRNFELIILDDCSTDNSREVIERYRTEPQVSQVCYNQVNSGSTFEQWNKGISAAKGAFIWIAESDDWCEPGFLSEVMAPLLQDNEVVLSFCQSLFISEEMKIIYQTSAAYLSEVMDGKAFIVKRMLGANYIANASMAVFRKQTAGAVAGEYKKMKYCGDWYFWVSLCMNGKAAVSGKYLNYYYRHGNNVASGATRMGLDFLEGNEVSRLILQKIAVDDADKAVALNNRIDMYLSAKEAFASREVNRKVLSSLYALDPSMKSRLVKKTAALKLRGYLSAIFKSIA